MIEGLNPIVQALLGTLFTWFMTAVGAGLVFFMRRESRKVLDVSLGFAAGVMTAALFWSLLAPALEIAELSGLYGQFSCLPVSVSFILGAGFVHMTDVFLKKCLKERRHRRNSKMQTEEQKPQTEEQKPKSPFCTCHLGPCVCKGDDIQLVHSFRKLGENIDEVDLENIQENDLHRIGNLKDEILELANQIDGKDRPNRLLPPQLLHTDAEANKKGMGLDWRSVLLLMIAVTAHNFPEGLAVGVGFGAVTAESKRANFAVARNLAIGMGIQNFPEGLAVSMPMRGSGYSYAKSFFYGQLSGAVEPIAGVLGALAVSQMKFLLPYMLAFSAGAMIFVVKDDLIPEAHRSSNGKLATWAAIVGFALMMALEAALTPAPDEPVQVCAAAVNATVFNSTL